MHLYIFGKAFCKTECQFSLLMASCFTDFTPESVSCILSRLLPSTAAFFEGEFRFIVFHIYIYVNSLKFCLDCTPYVYAKVSYTVIILQLERARPQQQQFSSSPMGHSTPKRVESEPLSRASRPDRPQPSTSRPVVSYSFFCLKLFKLVLV